MRSTRNVTQVENPAWQVAQVDGGDIKNLAKGSLEQKSIALDKCGLLGKSSDEVKVIFDAVTKALVESNDIQNDALEILKRNQVTAAMGPEHLKSLIALCKHTRSVGLFRNKTDLTDSAEKLLDFIKRNENSSVSPHAGMDREGMRPGFSLFASVSRGGASRSQQAVPAAGYPEFMKNCNHDKGFVHILDGLATEVNFSTLNITSQRNLGEALAAYFNNTNDVDEPKKWGNVEAALLGEAVWNEEKMVSEGGVGAEGSGVGDLKEWLQRLKSGAKSGDSAANRAIFGLLRKFDTKIQDGVVDSRAPAAVAHAAAHPMQYYERDDDSIPVKWTKQQVIELPPEQREWVKQIMESNNNADGFWRVVGIRVSDKAEFAKSLLAYMDDKRSTDMLDKPSYKNLQKILSLNHSTDSKKVQSLMNFLNKFNSNFSGDYNNCGAYLRRVLS